MLLGLCYQISLVQHTILHRIFLQYCDTLVDPVLAQQWGHTACMWTAAADHHGSLYSIRLFCWMMPGCCSICIQLKLQDVLSPLC